MTVRNSLNAMGLANRLSINSNQTGKTSRNIASGSRINRAANDAAGLAIAMKMQSQIGGTGQAVRNVADGMSLIQTAEGALGGTQAMLGRIEMLSVQAANGTLTDTQRGFIQMEIDQIKSEINRVSSATNFNGINLLDGSVSGENGGLTLQIGADDAAEQRFDVNIEAMNTRALGLSGLDVRTAGSALNAIGDANRAIGLVSEQRASLGAMQNRLEHTVNGLTNASENLTAAKSRIGDADMAAEMIALTTNNILQQASIAMLAHKIKEPQGVLKLLGQNTAPSINFKA
ncbi:MAG: flagellin [Oscillospiraceae bacterium]|nr:flagellin [Oscillospiraceae bacterium]